MGVENVIDVPSRVIVGLQRENKLIALLKISIYFTDLQLQALNVLLELNKMQMPV